MRPRKTTPPESNDHELTAAQTGVLEHLHRTFAGHSVEVVPLPDEHDRVLDYVTGFHVAHVGPGPATGPLHTFVTLGIWDATRHGEHGLEFFIHAPEKDERIALLLAMIGHYHAGPDVEQRLDLGHTLPIGEPWLPGSLCDHWLISLPYTLGPEFEHCDLPDGHARMLWLIPITKAERDFKAANGLEALESRFEAVEVAYDDPSREQIDLD